jgi:hypothetical protein
MVSYPTRIIVWTRSGGRCNFPGCNEYLLDDFIAGKEDKNYGLIAHIIAETPGGPRGDPIRSPELADDPCNLMMMCYKHHKTIDDEEDCYPEQLLLDMKATHEERVKIATGITEDRATYVLRYAANIGSHSSPVSFPKVRVATFPNRYPSGGQSIAIEVKGSVQTDAADLFWKLEPENLRQQFATLVKSRIDTGEINHLSVFALAPIPLLVELGRLLGGITPADVYQLHREPAGWPWAATGSRIGYNTTTPANKSGPVALKLGLSATITDDRITSVLGKDASIWSIQADAPGNDNMRYPEDLAKFRGLLRQTYQAIKAAHGTTAVINIFPAIAVSAAVEIGRVWMPKADLPLTIFDEVRGHGFVPRLGIGH